MRFPADASLEVRWYQSYTSSLTFTVCDMPAVYCVDALGYLQHPTFRERSETPELSTEISLQPWRNYKTDGVILFSDILTPLPVSVVVVGALLFVLLLFCAPYQPGRGLDHHTCV